MTVCDRMVKIHLACSLSMGGLKITCVLHFKATHAELKTTLEDLALSFTLCTNGILLLLCACVDKMMPHQSN